MDAVLMSLLKVPNDFIDRHILFNDYSKGDLQTIILQLTKAIRDEIRDDNVIVNSQPLLDLLARGIYHEGWSNFSNTNEQHAAEEFIKFIFAMFKVEHTCILQTTFTYPHGIVQREDLITPVHYIWEPLLQKHDSIADHLVSVELYPSGNRYHLISKKTIYSRCDYLVVDLPRGTVSDGNYNLLVDGENPRYTMNQSYVFLNDSISIGENTLYLIAAIMYRSGHYVLVYKHANIWYFSDDCTAKVQILGPDMRKVADYDVDTECVLCFYSIKNIDG
jgi:hypothetical protein